MSSLRQWLYRLGSSFRQRPLDRGMEDEMRLHLDMEMEAARRRGLSPSEAERVARLRAGSIAGSLDAVRDQRGLPWLTGAVDDLRHAMVSLGRHRGFTVVALIALTLAVGVNALILALVDGVLLRPLPYPHPERLVRIFDSSEQNPLFPMSAGNFLDYRRESRTLESLALYTGNDLELMHEERPERITAVQISPEFFPTLGIRLMLGRNFVESEMRGNPRVVILGHKLWTTRFHQDRHIVGKTIRLNREPWTVIGVLPPGVQHIGGTYRSPLHGETVDLWWPISLDLPPNGLRNWHFMNAIARLKPGVTLADANADLNRIADDIRRRIPDSVWRAVIMPLTQELVGKSQRTVWLLLAAGIVVLAIACANIAGLSIARALARRRDLAVRQALGAGLWRLVRAQVSENLLLGLAGGAVGLVLAAALLPLMRVLLPTDFPRLHEVRLSLLACSGAIAAALFTSLLAGLFPAFRQAATDPLDALGESRSTSTGRATSRFRAALVCAQVALASLLCVSAALLLRSSHMLNDRDHGFHSEGVLVFDLSLPGLAYPKAPDRVRLLQGALERWRQLPGVVSAAVSTNVPWTGYDENTSFGIPGRPTSDGESPQGRQQMTTPGWFTTLRVPLRKGRLLEERDDAQAPLVIVVNESLVSRYFPSEEPIGRELDLWGAKRKIVGVVADIADRPADLSVEPAFWFPAYQVLPSRPLKVVIRTAGDPVAIANAAAQALHEIDTELPLAGVTTLDQIARAAFAERNFALWLLETFALLAMSLAAFGIYGLLAYTVTQRRKEIGIRSALGATPGDNARMVFRDAAVLCGTGLGLSLLLAPAASRMLASFLYGVSPFDIISMAAAPALILAISLLASIVPAWTAANGKPLTALRDS